MKIVWHLQARMVEVRLAHKRFFRTWPTTLYSLYFAVEKGRKNIFTVFYVLTSSSFIRSRPIFHPFATQENDTESIDPTASPTPTSSYNGYGRIFQRQTNPFTAISTIVVTGIRHETADSDDETPDDEATWVFCPSPPDSGIYTTFPIASNWSNAGMFSVE